MPRKPNGRPSKRVVNNVRKTLGAKKKPSSTPRIRTRRTRNA